MESRSSMRGPVTIRMPDDAGGRRSENISTRCRDAARTPHVKRSGISINGTIWPIGQTARRPGVVNLIARIVRLTGSGCSTRPGGRQKRAPADRKRHIGQRLLM